MSKFMKSLCKIAIPVTLQSMLQIPAHLTMHSAMN